MAYTNRRLWEPLRSIDSATLTGSYQKVGTPFVHAPVLVKLVNNSTVLVTISTDGVTDYDVAPQNSFWLYDENTSSTPGFTFIPAGTQMWVKGSAGTGSIYLVVQYIVVQ